MNDQTAQMGFQVGKTALNAGQEYVEQNVSERHPLGFHYYSSSFSLSTPVNLGPTVQSLCERLCPEALL